MIPKMDIESSLNHGTVMLDQLHQVYQGFFQVRVDTIKSTI